MIRHQLLVSCDRSEEDGVICVQISGSTVAEIREREVRYGWTHHGAYDECPRHAAKEPAR